MNSFPRRRDRTESIPLSRLARLLGVEAPEPDVEVIGLRPLETAETRHLGFLADRKYLKACAESGAGAILVSSELAGEVTDDGRPLLVVEEAHQALATLLEHLHPAEEDEPGIHPTAVLGRGVRLGEDVQVGPFAVLEDGVQVGDRSRIGAHAVIGTGSRLGCDVLMHPHSVLYPGTVLGDRVILHAGVCIGADGFGYVFQDGKHRKVPQVGGCVLGNDVEIGANTTIDRGSIGDTRVGEGAKLDNLVQIGHNVTVGPLAVLSGQAGVAGSTAIGTGVLVGGQAGIGGHLRVGDGARISGQAGVTGDVPPGDTVMGFPARTRGEYLRTAAAQAKLPELRKRVGELERAVAALEEELRGRTSGPGESRED